MKVGVSILIAICAVWTTTSYYSRTTIPRYPLVSPSRVPGRTSTNTVTVMRTRLVTTTALQTRLVTTTATSIQTATSIHTTTETATSIQTTTSIHTRACRCSSYTTTTTSTFTLAPKDPRDDSFGVPSSCVCTLSGSVAVGTASPISIGLQVEQDIAMEGSIGSA